jgi:subtilase family serine protease
MVIDFSGNAGQVRRAFHTSIHNLNVNGVHHIANFGDPQIPEALAPAVAGIVSLHDFRPHKMSRPKNTAGRPQYTLATGSRLTRLWFPPIWRRSTTSILCSPKGITGTGQTIA